MSDSLITKKAIVEALKQICREKPFDKVSIGDMTTACGLNRQTFYYHFQDKYELLSWIFYHEIFVVTTDGISLDNWDEKIQQMMEIMRQDKPFYTSTVKEQERTFEGYLFEMSKHLFLSAIDKLDDPHKLNEKEREFDAEFYSYGVCGVIISWVERGMKEEPQIMALQLRKLAEASEHMASARTRV